MLCHSVALSTKDQDQDQDKFDSMQTLIVLIEFTPFVNFLTNDNSRCLLY